MKFQYLVEEVSVTNWQEIMDSDDVDTGYQHLNKWGAEGWEIICIVPKLEKGATVSYGVVFKRQTE